MISDPKTTPDSRTGRILFTMLVAAGAAYVQFGLYRTNGLLWSLAIVSILTPLIDYLLYGTKYRWNSLIHRYGKMEIPVKRLGLFLALLGLSANAGPAHGFYGSPRLRQNSFQGFLPGYV